MTFLVSGVTREVVGGGGRTALGDTLQGVTPDLKFIFMPKFRKNTG